LEVHRVSSRRSIVELAGHPESALANLVVAEKASRMNRASSVRWGARRWWTRLLTLLVRDNVAAYVTTAPRVLDLDDLGPEVGKVDRAEGSRPVLLDRNDPQVFERQQRQALR
jgi:hypothetical protein